MLCSFAPKSRVEIDPKLGLRRIQKLCWGLNADHVDVIEVSKKVIAGVYNGVTTVELDQLAAEVCKPFTKTRKVVVEADRLGGTADCRIHDNTASGLCHPRCPYRDIQLAQGDEEDFLACYQGSLRVWSVRGRDGLCTLLTLPAVNPKNNKPSPMISEATYNTVMKHEETLNSAVLYDRDFSYVCCMSPFNHAILSDVTLSELFRLQDP